MRFCPWYPLADAATHAPPAENVLQLRVADGLVDYPRGRSAMVRYVHAPDARATAIALATEHAADALWCRHLIADDAGPVAEVAAAHARVLREFVARFGAAPALDPRARVADDAEVIA